LRTYQIDIKGVVQGVGFRPFVYRLSHELNITGEVYNNSLGVTIRLNATNKELELFLEKLQKELPPLSKIDSIETKEIAFKEFTNFSIIQTSEQNLKTALLPPDISICKECEAELFDKNNRRYLYPFITCTNCGVRYSIIEKLPYDRVNTSMKFFTMCKECEKEYNNPLDRRYHAQPIGCWNCGPTIELLVNNQELKAKGLDAIKEAVSLLKSGKIIALKGVGGYHLICDATNEEALKELRKRKKRADKPFAVMVKDISMARDLAIISKKEEELLNSKERPIVICKSLLPSQSQIAPNINKIGLFLPYTPLHLLILEKLQRPIVATSANISDEPIATNLESLQSLQNVYDAVLEHNREIVNGCDDSVVMLVQNRVITLRRARGYTPLSIKLPFKLKRPTLALGANQKSTIAIGFEDNAILSPHIGDLNGIGSIEYYKKNINTLQRIYNFEPQKVVCDLHPNYESTKYAFEIAKENKDINLHQVQHHHAHILACMAEHKIKGKVFGVAFDGTGLGTDKKLWGGEFLLCDYHSFQRVAHINYFKLLGGGKAIKEPKRVALSLLFDIFGKEALSLNIPTIKAFKKEELNLLYLAWQKGLNAPLSSSVGRLFDAVASISGVIQELSFEGQSGLLLEELYDKNITSAYNFNVKNSVISTKELIKEMIQESNKTVAVSKFFNTIVTMVASIYKEYSNYPLVLSGGVFQNTILLNLLLQKFPNIYISSKIPPNDGGIALGQIVSLSK
jgi:hydrogenase maturation protein HypF